MLRLFCAELSCLFFLRFLDGGEGADLVSGFGAHEDDALGGAFELRDVFDREFDDDGFLGGDDSFAVVLGDDLGGGDVAGFVREVGDFYSLAAAFLGGVLGDRSAFA